MLTDYDIRKGIEIAETILSYYKYPMVKIKVLNHSSQTYIECQSNVIYIGRFDFWNIDNIIIHELSHLISYHRHGYIYKNDKRISHGKDFIKILKEIIMLWYNNIDAYCWDYEYSSIKKEYHKSKC